jgi:predicted dehydrogenase
VLAAAKRKNVVIQEAMTVFHMPLYHKLRALIEDGLIGQVKLVQVNFGSWKDDLSSRFFQPEAAGGALLDIGGYASSFARVFLEQIPTKFSATVKFHPSGVDEAWVIGMENDAGQIVNMSLSMCAKQPKRGVVSGEKGYIEVDDYPRATSANVFFVSDGHTETITAGIGGRHALQYEVEDMEELVANPRESKSLQFTSEIVHMLSDIRERYGVQYPCE